MNLARVTDEFASTKAENERLETEQPLLAQKFSYYQELRGYVTDLVECLDEKVGSYVSITTGGEHSGGSARPVATLIRQQATCVTYAIIKLHEALLTSQDAWNVYSFCNFSWFFHEVKNLLTCKYEVQQHSEPVLNCRSRLLSLCHPAAHAKIGPIMCLCMETLH
jgi:hypothetical protein